MRANVNWPGKRSVYSPPQAAWGLWPRIILNYDGKAHSVFWNNADDFHPNCQRHCHFRFALVQPLSFQSIGRGQLPSSTSFIIFMTKRCNCCGNTQSWREKCVRCIAGSFPMKKFPFHTYADGHAAPSRAADQFSLFIESVGGKEEEDGTAIINLTMREKNFSFQNELQLPPANRKQLFLYFLSNVLELQLWACDAHALWIGAWKIKVKKKMENVNWIKFTYFAFPLRSLPQTNTHGIP